MSESLRFGTQQLAVDGSDEASDPEDQEDVDEVLESVLQ